MPENTEPADAQALRIGAQERAYALWESEGGPCGHDLDYWLRAEAEMTASDRVGEMTASDGVGSSEHTPNQTTASKGR